MSDNEARDAYVGVEVDLPNGALVRGKPIPYADAMRLMVLSDQWAEGGNPKETVRPLLEEFHRITGITVEELSAKDPNMTFADMLSLVNRFFFLRSPGPSPSNGNGATAPNGA